MPSSAFVSHHSPLHAPSLLPICRKPVATGLSLEAFKRTLLRFRAQVTDALGI